MHNHPRHVLITGASAGIGAELARQLASRGLRLSLAARRLNLLQEQAPALLRLGAVAVHSFACDVLEREQVLQLALDARAAQGEIDVWVSNAGSGLRQRLLDTTEEQMLEQFRLNCLSALWGYQAVLPGWLASGHPGQIIDVCSLGGKSGYAFNGAYSAAKHAMSALGDTLRQELAALPQARGICVTTVYPGPTVSDFGVRAQDLTGGVAVASVTDSRRSRNPLARGISSKQDTAALARAIVAALRSRRPTVYPHRWGTIGILINNLLPGLVLRMLRQQAQGHEQRAR